MRTADAISHFGSPVKLAGALKIRRQAVYQWGEFVPMRKAVILEALTGGVLRPAYPLPEGVSRKPRKRRSVHGDQAVTESARICPNQPGSAE